MLTSEHIIKAITPRILELTLLPTEQCNFRCTYCYEDFSIGKMQPETVEAIKNFVRHRIINLDILKISWFGGEPLAAKDIVYDLSEFFLALSKKHNVILKAGMTTNGFQLKQDVLNNLINLGVKQFQISLDGTEAFHNQTRKRMDGAGTFQKIWSHLLDAKNSTADFSIILRIHVHPANFANVKKLIDQLNCTFGGDHRFTVFFKAIENLGGNNFATLDQQTKSESIDLLKKELYPTLQSNILSDNTPYICYAAKPNAFMIRANGTLGKCTVALNNPHNRIGHLRQDGTFDLEQDKLKAWSRGLISQKQEELACPANGLSQHINQFKQIPIVHSS